MLSPNGLLRGAAPTRAELRIPIGTVMTLADRYRRRDLHAVAFDLIAWADDHAPDQVEAVERETAAFIDRAARLNARLKDASDDGASS
jgi:hypothetical protein